MSKEHIDSLYKTITQVVEIFHFHGAIQAVLSPGSRSAALALSIMRNKKFDCFHIPDERSAAYFALGLSKKSKRPTILVCTSGTAALNYAPAVAEAYFQKIPLCILTADRPVEWIDQNDNQAIFQENLYGKHVAKSFSMPVDFISKQNAYLAERYANEAMLCAVHESLPVHINCPIREPFYSEKRVDTVVSPRIINQVKTETDVSGIFLNDLIKTLRDSKNTWLIIGETQETFPEKELSVLVKRFQIQCFIDPLSNVHIKDQYHYFNEWVGNEGVQKPDLILSTGKHFLSKSLKEFIKSCSVSQHLHISESRGVHDPFQSFTHLLNLPFSKLITSLYSATESVPNKSLNTKYYHFEKQAAERKKAQILEDAELRVAQEIMHSLPKNSVLHLGNSSPVRYSLWASEIIGKKQIQIFANRGTSGIDGSVSTAVAMAQEDDRENFLLLGDLSMFYDRNGLWHKYVPSNFKILVINNRGGGIFARIDGPKSQPEFQEYFLNTQPTDFQSLAQTHGFQYYLVEKLDTLPSVLQKDGKLLLEFKL